jgi:hypothetical protein
MGLHELPVIYTLEVKNGIGSRFFCNKESGASDSAPARRAYRGLA